MQLIVITFVTLLTLVGVAPAGHARIAATGDGPPPAGTRTLPAGTRDLTEPEASIALKRIFQGRRYSALAFVDSLKAECEGYPLYHIIRARILQERVPMDDLSAKYASWMSQGPLEELDRAINECTRRLESGDTNPRLRLYRGWAWMSKSYIRTITRNLFTAGREAKRGKKDLEAYLAIVPDDPDANGLLGAFLYFADTIPGAFKLLSKLLFLPGGDRERGLDMLARAIRRDGLLQMDYELVTYNVYFFFEGRYEEGLAGMREMNLRYPAYTRTALPLAIAMLYVPRLAAEFEQRVQSTIQAVYSGPNRDVDWNSLYLVQFFRAYTGRYYEHSRGARTKLQSLIYEGPAHPDWLVPAARIELGGLYATIGEPAEAREMFESVLRMVAPAYLHDLAKDMLEDLVEHDDIIERSLDRPPERWIEALYHSGPDSLEALAARFKALASMSPVARFYVGECRLFAQDLDGALEAYQSVIESDVPLWEETYLLISCTRIAEILATRKDYARAADYEDQALNFAHHEYLIDWILEGRRRYFKRLSEGKETAVHPSLILTTP